jgi:hypothetical protein
MDLQQYMGPIITIIVLVVLCFAAYYIFRGSSLGKFLGSIFGDANAITDWLGNEFKNCSENGLTSSSCSLGPWIIGGLVLLGIFGLLKAASILKPFLPEGTRKYVEQYGYDGKEAIEDYQTAEANFNEEVQKGTLDPVQQKFLDNNPNNPAAKDALIKARANGISTRRRLETIKEKGKNTAQDKTIAEGVTKQRDITRQDIANDAKDNDVDSDGMDDALESAEAAE